MPWQRHAARGHTSSTRTHARFLHARWVRGTSSVLTASARARASPSQGLLLSVSPALPALWELGGLTHACPTATLVRSLWHRNEPQEPLRQTHNKSLPGAHLASSPKLQGHVFGLVLSGANSDAVEAALREQGIAQLARATKVSISRFVRVVELAQSGLAEDSMPCGLSPCAVMLAFLWTTASSKACLLDFLEAAATHLPPASLLGGEYNAVCERWRARWSESAYTQQCAADGSPSASAAASSLSGLTTWPPAAEAVELLAFALAVSMTRDY